MNRQQYIAAMSLIFLSIILLGSLLVTAWPDGEFTQIPLGELGSGTFEMFGPTFLIVGLLMFAAMLGGVFIAREEDE